MRVLHVVPTFFPATYFGGPIYSVYGLCNALVWHGDVDLRVLTTDSSGPARADRLTVASFPFQRPEGYDVYYCQKACGREFSLRLLRLLPMMIRWADVVHLTSAYSFSTIPTLLLCRLMRKPVVWSPRGALQRWAGSTRPRMKRLWERLSSLVADNEHCVQHVTSAEEASESLAKVRCARAEVIPNGVDIPPQVPPRDWKPEGRLRLLFIGRLHPKKGVENLLQALKVLDEKVSLSVCGTGEPGYVSLLRTLVNDLGLSHRVDFTGHVEGEAKPRAFWNADICVVPSYTENFAMVVAEALAHGVPVIASQGTPWKELAERQCGLRVENDPASLVKAITEMRYLDLRQMGERGREWMQQHYSWPAVAQEMLAVYRRLTAEAI